MLSFRSGSARAVNTERAALEALDLAGVSAGPSLLLFNSTMGHDVAAIASVLQRERPGARVLGCSCAGIVGREGAGESMREVSLLAAEGEGTSVAWVDGLDGRNSFAKGQELARGLSAPRPLRGLYLLASGIDISNDALIRGLESVLGSEVTIFGGTSSDQMQGIATFQCADGQRMRHGAYAVGFWDETLSFDTQATHGFVATGEPMVVTAADANRILELDGRPAWPQYLERLGLPGDATLAHTIPIGALAERIEPAAAEEYGNPHVLRVVTQHGPAGEMVYSTEIAVGTPLWLTVRDEKLIFDDMDRMMTAMTARQAGRKPVAVIQADCLARGRRLFQRIVKEELVARMQAPLSPGGEVPPWFGMYGFGEYARLGGANLYHNYTTALGVVYR